MTPVTDPNLIAQLEQNAPVGGMTPVTDPALIAQLEGNSNSPLLSAAKGQNEGNLPSQIYQAGGNAVLGAGDALRNLGVDAYNLATGRNAQLAPSSAGQAYNVGNFLGNTGAFLGGGEGLEAARAASEAVPYAGQVAKLLGGQGLPSAAKGFATAAKRALGTAGYGALTNPNDPSQGAATGAGLSLAADAIPGTAGLIGKASQYFQPQKYAQQILDTLGNGQTLEGNAQSLAQRLQQAFQQRKGEGSGLFYPVFNSVRDRPLYDGINPSESNYPALDIDSLNYDHNLKKLDKQFTANPTFENAHNLQSQLGSAIRKLQDTDSKGNLSVADRSTMQGYQDAQDALRNDMGSFLQQHDALTGDNLNDQYNNALGNWAENVAPYLDNPKITKIAKGAVTNPSAIASIFKNPEPDVQKIVSDMGPDAANKILYSELGKHQYHLTPEILQNAYNKLDNAGLNSYVTPSLAQQFDTLGKRIRDRDALQKGGGFLAGAGAGHLFGGALSPISELLGAGLGGVAIPRGMHLLQQMLPIEKIGKALSTAGRVGYRPAAASVIANNTGGQ